MLLRTNFLLSMAQRAALVPSWLVAPSWLQLWLQSEKI